MSSSERAVKGTYAVHEWDPEALAANLEASRQKLKLLERPVKSIPRGIYRTFLEPAAVAELLSLFSWDCIGEKSIRLKQSPLRFLREGNRTLSPHFSLKEDFTNDDIPRFNEAGELAPEVMHLICNGQLAGTLISSSTAKEYNLKHTGAASDERLRAPCMSGGGLAGGDILKRLDTGMLISNLHYLNWSDHSGGGMTGMTRYACFWVENGKIAAPIENLRFDDNLFTLFGSAVEAVTSDVVSVPLVQTYFHRQLGATRAPGMLLSRMRFTL
jgi:predicted Zn-dependent protease